MANIYVYNAVAIAAGILPNCQTQAANYKHVPCLTEEKVKKVIFSCGSNVRACTAIYAVATSD